MTESELYSWLQRYEIQTPKHIRFGLNEEIDVDFFPAVLKVESSKVIHKSDVGGVVVGLHSNAELNEAKEMMIQSIASHGITLEERDGFIVSEMVMGDELYVGAVDDEIFDHVILFGKGGIYLELYKDIAYIDSEADEAEIIRAVKKTKFGKLFEGYRGSPHTLKEAVDVVKKVQKLLAENPQIIEFDLNPIKLTKWGLIAVDGRVKFRDKPKGPKSKRENRPLFLENRSVAIIGASTDESKVGYAIAKNAASFQGELYYVNPKGGELFGRPLFQNVEAIPGDVDMAVLVIPVSSVIPTIEKLVLKNLKNLVIITAGFKESGNEEDELKIAELAKKHNFNVIGPNCLGYYNAQSDLNLTFGSSNVHKGNLALISQSGAVLASLMDKAYSGNVGFSHLISAGNMVDLNFSEMVDMLVADPACEAISVYAEGIKNGKRFLRSIRRSHKKIYVFKTGKSEESKKAAFSHTGNLSGNYEMFKGLLEGVGVKMEDNIEALLFNPTYEVQKIAIITNAGGPATILTDYIIEKGKSLHALTKEEIERLDLAMPPHWSKNNPIDIIGDALPERYLKALEIVDEFEEIDLIYLLITPQFMTDALETVKLLKHKDWKHPVLPILLGGDMVEQAKQFCRSRKMQFFKTLQSATSFL